MQLPVSCNMQLPKPYKKVELSRAEREIIKALKKYNTTQEMADYLFITEGTVKAHLTHIYKKFNAQNRLHLYKIIINRGL